MSTQSKGIQLALLTAVISGIAIFINKFAVDAINPPLVFTAMKNVGVGALIISFLILSSKWKLVKTLRKREWIYLILIGIIGGSIPFYLYFTGLSMTPAINAALIHKTLVFWVILLAVPFLKEKLSPLQLLAVVLLFAGNLTIGGFKGFHYSQGEFFILMATMLWAVENILAKKILPNVDPDIVTSARMGFGSVILLGAAALTAPAALSTSLALTSIQWFWMVLTMVTLLGYVMSWYRALKYAPAITVSAVLVAGTLVTNVLSAVFITHTLTVDLMIQTIFILAGTGLFWFISKKEAKLQDLQPQA